MADWSLQADGQDYQAHDRSGGSPWGVVAVTSGVAHTKGAWSVCAANAFGSSWLAVHLHGYTSLTGSPASPLKALVDVAVGAPGSEQLVVSNLLFLCGTSSGSQPSAVTCVLPLALPAAAALSCRAQASAGVPASFAVSLTTAATGWAASAGGADCQTWGDSPTTSDGTNVVPGVAPAFGSYAALTALSSAKADWLTLAFGLPGSYPAAGTRHAYLVDVAVGGAGAEVVVLPAWPVAFDELGRAQTPFTPPLPVSLPAGSRVSVRATTTTGGPNLSVAAYATGG